jgi:hypothetical protein
MMRAASKLSKARANCKKKFLEFFPKGFDDPKYHSWERKYKWNAHQQWEESLNRKEYERLLNSSLYDEIAKRAVNIETKTNLLFSFEKMALRDAVISPAGAKLFAKGLFDYIYGRGTLQARFETFIEVIGRLPRKQTRVLTWPLVTVFGFIARPDKFIFLKPMVTRTAAAAYGFPFQYRSKPGWETYHSLFDFANQLCEDTADLNPRDLIDIQSFIWVMGSDEYE